MDDDSSRSGSTSGLVATPGSRPSSARLVRTKSLPASKLGITPAHTASEDEEVTESTGPTTRYSIAYIASLLKANAEDKRDVQQRQTEHYEVIMKRFQLRKVQYPGRLPPLAGGGGTAVQTGSASGLVVPAADASITGVEPDPASPDSRPADDGAISDGAASILPASDGANDPDGGEDRPKLRMRASTGSLPMQEGVPAAPETCPTYRTPTLRGTEAGGGTEAMLTSRSQTHPSAKSSTRKRRTSLRSKVRRLVRRTRRRIRNSTWLRVLAQPIHPMGRLQAIRQGILLLSFIVQIIYLPLQIVYLSHETVYSTVLHVTFEWLFCLDLLLTFNTAIFDANERLVTSRIEIAKTYLHGWFALDLLSSIPFDTVLYIATGKNFQQTHPIAYLFVDNIARIPRLVHFSRTLRTSWLAIRVVRGGATRAFWAGILYSRYSHLLRIVLLILVVILTAHYMSCLWHVLDSSTLSAAAIHAASSSHAIVEMYVSSYLTAVLLIHGQGVTTDNPTQTAYSILVVLIGSFILAIVFGNVAMLVSNFNANATNYQRKMEQVVAMMDKMQLPVELQDRIHHYFVHLWQEYESLDGDLVKFSKELTPTLALEVGLFQYMNLIMKIPYWNDCSPDFVTQIILKLVVRVYLPDDFIVRKGEMNQDLYMINRGTCERIVPDSDDHQPIDSMPSSRSLRRANTGLGSGDAAQAASRRLHSLGQRRPSFIGKPGVGPIPSRSKRRGHALQTLTAGQSFGEMALVMNYEVEHNIRATTYVEMCVLSRREFQLVLLRFQDDRMKVLTSLLRYVIEKDELPFALDLTHGITVRDDESVTGPEPSAPSPAPTSRRVMNSQAAAELLATQINREVQDPTIKFGFQTLEREARLKMQQDAQALAVATATAIAAATGTSVTSSSATIPTSMATTIATPIIAQPTQDALRVSTTPILEPRTRRRSSGESKNAATDIAAAAAAAARDVAATVSSTTTLTTDPNAVVPIAKIKPTVTPNHSTNLVTSDPHLQSISHPPSQDMHARVHALTARVQRVEQTQSKIIEILASLRASTERIHAALTVATGTPPPPSDKTPLRPARDPSAPKMRRSFSLPSDWDNSATPLSPPEFKEAIQRGSGSQKELAEMTKALAAAAAAAATTSISASTLRRSLNRRRSTSILTQPLVVPSVVAKKDGKVVVKGETSPTARLYLPQKQTSKRHGLLADQLWNRSMDTKGNSRRTKKTT